MEDKIYFMPGDIVTLRQQIDNVPQMIVVKKVSNMYKDRVEDTLIGIKCRWFTRDGHLEEAIFNTKDLIKLK